MKIRFDSFYILLLLTLVLGTGELCAQPGTFTSVTSEHVAELEAMHQQAIDHLLKNDFQAAIRAYSDILLVEPDDETAYTGLGQIYLVQGRVQKAHEAFQNALAINPDNEVALVGIRRILDPDGTDGMISAQEAELENTPKTAPAPLRAEEALSVQMTSPGGMDKRFSAVKVKKGAVFPAPKADAAVRVPRKGSSLKPGFLHAQRAQMALKNAGYFSGPVNGLLGASTREALGAFQKDQGMTSSRRLDAATWSRLSEYL